MILFSHPTGNANVRQAALGLKEAGLLGEFWTCLAPEARAAWVRCLPAGLRRQVLRRAAPEELAGRIRMRPGRELGRLAAVAAGWGWPVRREEGFCSVDAVYQDLDTACARRVERSGGMFSGVYGYEDGALETFRAAGRAGAAKIYDLPIGYWRAARELLTEEAELRPEWAGTLPGNLDSAGKTARKDEEIALADRIVVATTFTRETLKRHPGFGAEVSVTPYGAPVVAGGEKGRRERGGRLRVLFAGSLGQRKGLAYLLEAVELLGAGVELTLIGRPAGRCAPLERALGRHRWIESCPHAEMLAEMRRHDVLVFPSLFEGFGLVILEAMAQGTPVITTGHTAGPDVITDGVDGFIVPIRSAEVIAARLEGLARDGDELERMGRAARATAERFAWADYRRGVAGVVADVLGGRAH
jgi:glycosyltransferase involved in cell wall biosynthesis